VIVEQDGRTYNYSSELEMAEILFSENLLGFIEDFQGWFFEYIIRLVGNGNCSVLCNRFGDVSSVKFSHGKSTRWIVLAKAWGESATLDFIHHLDSLFRWIGIGVFNTPGSLGVSILRRSWRIHKLKFHTSPSQDCCEYFYTNQTGGRVDTPGLHKYYDVGMEYDEDTAYLSRYPLQVTGTAIRYDLSPSDKYFAWFGKCKVKIKHELALGPFPIRLENGLVKYPTLPGKYETYIWSNQYHEILKQSCDVEFMGGFGWLQSTTDNMEFCKEMYDLRLSAPDEYLEAFMKIVIVATLGRNGMKGHFQTLVSEDKKSPEDIPVFTNDGMATNFFIHPEVNKRAIPMVHWFNYTIQEVALDTYRFALPYAERGELIATNYDSVLTLNTQVNPNSVRKHTTEDIIRRAGDWRWQRLTGIYIPAPRAINCDQKYRRPGVRNVEELTL
jgi:hypothetical protein